MSALAGRSIVITRARGQHAELARLVTARRGIPVLFPTITIEPLTDPAPIDAVIDRLSGYDWLVFTSANAAAHFASRLAARRDGHLPDDLRVAAIGPATARSAAARGLSVAVVSTESRGVAIPADLGDLSGRRVLLPRGDLAREETVAALERAGARVTELVVYRTVPAAPDPDGLATIRAGVDAFTFASPSSIRHFVTLVGREAVDILRPTAVACIGPTTAAAAVAVGVAAPLVASQPTSASLVEVLEARFQSAASRAGGRR